MTNADPLRVDDLLALCTAGEMSTLRPAVGQPGLMGRSIAALASRLEPHLGQPCDVPGHGEAGSHAHNRHQLNGRLCEDAGTLYRTTGETTMLLRRRGGRHLFASVFETHGFFEATECCRGARGELDEVRILGHDDTASVIELRGERLHLIVAASNRPDIAATDVTEVTFGDRTCRWEGFVSCTPA